jgi:predicted acyltransferase
LILLRKFACIELLIAMSGIIDVSPIIILIGNSPILVILYENVFKPFGDDTGSLLYAIARVLWCMLVGWWLDRKRIYVRVYFGLIFFTSHVLP